MTELSSEQSVWVAPGVIGNETKLGYDVLRGIELAKVMSESLRTEQMPGDATLKQTYGAGVVRPVGKPISPKDYLVHDTQSGLYLKSYPDIQDAELQFAVMNTLASWLADANVGVKAVRHFALIERAPDVPVAVIEPAEGKRLHEMKGYASKKEIRAMLKDVRARLNVAIGKRASRALINDLDQPLNVGGNVFIDEEGRYTLIDQPVTQLSNKKKVREIVLEAGWPLPLQQSSWVDLLSFDPHDSMRVR